MEPILNTSKPKRNRDQVFVHIGLGKTSTTLLQRTIFPELCKFIGYKYWEADSDLRNQIVIHSMKMRLGLSVTSIDVPDKTFISNEALVSGSSFNPADYSKFAEMNRIAFGEKAQIIITIRHPKELLTSFYLQTLMEGRIQLSNYYFLDDKRYSDRYSDSSFAVDRFSYDYLIDLYRKKFENVTVVKYEALSSFEFLKELFALDPVFMTELQKLYKSTSNRGVNRGYSGRAVRYTIRLENFLNRYFGLTLRTGYSHVDLLRHLFEKNHSARTQVRYIKNIQRWRRFMQQGVDRVLPYKKYELDFRNLPYIDLEALQREYSRLPDVITFKRRERLTDQDSIGK